MIYKTHRAKFDSVDDAAAAGVGGFAHDGQAITNPWRSPDMFRAVDPREEYGFQEVETGGGCTAWELRDDDGARVMLTAAYDPVAPTCEHDWCLGIYRVRWTDEPDWSLRVAPGEPVRFMRLDEKPLSPEERRRRLIVNGEPMTLGEFFDHNRDGLSWGDRYELRTLKPGRGYMMGGGVAAVVAVHRPPRGSEPGTQGANDAYRFLSEAALKLEAAAHLLGGASTLHGTNVWELAVAVRRERNEWNAGH